MLPKTGSPVPRPTKPISEAEYAAAICAALRAELGATGVAAKTIMRWAGVSDRTARNWMTGVSTPSAHHLMSLARQSDGVMSAILTLAARPELALAADLHAIEVALAKASGAFEVLRRQRTASGMENVMRR